VRLYCTVHLASHSRQVVVHPRLKRSRHWQRLKGGYGTKTDLLKSESNVGFCINHGHSGPGHEPSTDKVSSINLIGRQCGRHFLDRTKVYATATTPGPCVDVVIWARAACTRSAARSTAPRARSGTLTSCDPYLICLRPRGRPHGRCARAPRFAALCERPGGLPPSQSGGATRKNTRLVRLGRCYQTIAER
jgi:hypothetical protein